MPELEPLLGGTCIKHLPLLPQTEAKVILDGWFQAINRSLTIDQKSEIITSFSLTGLPLYLKLAFEQAKHWHSYTDDYTLEDDVEGIINSLMESLEHEHTREFVQIAICYMLCGRYQGLTENEILEVLAFDKEYCEIFLKNTHPDHRKELVDFKEEIENPENGVKGFMKIPIVVWSRLFHDLEPFLTERDADGV